MCCQVLEWKLQVDLTVKQAGECIQSELMSTVIQYCWSIGRVHSGNL